MNKGYFITLEGPDGSGKSTQLEHLANWLAQRGYEVVRTREPGGSEAAERLRDLVLDPQLTMDERTETLLYLAARADHLAKVVRPALAAGQVVLCDRFSDSTLVYQGFVRGLQLTELMQLNAFATGGLEPDLTLLLDGDPERLAARREERGVTDRFENEGLAFQIKVRQGFLELAKANTQRIRVIDAMQQQEAVSADLVKELEALLKS
ncbi:dTMP kinase [uncultured Phascolarctobacterium sp.]|uniref:dTMP kinase n=1 Tax=Phascolarctobacterium sp. TaxID=2049039 RepID=UPI0025FCC45F|nr:dTMP kinase [uncultured Phascolarctobacterium sp.]